MSPGNTCSTSCLWGAKVRQVFGRATVDDKDPDAPENSVQSFGTVAGNIPRTEC